MDSHTNSKGGTQRSSARRPERRAYPRFLLPRSASCRARPVGCGGWWTCQGLDVSLAGLAVLSPQPAPEGQVLIVELRRVETAPVVTRLMRVSYSFPMPGGGHRVGGAFLRELTQAELDQLFS
jgi:hypothetical protein